MLFFKSIEVCTCASNIQVTEDATVQLQNNQQILCKSYLKKSLIEHAPNQVWLWFETAAQYKFTLKTEWILPKDTVVFYDYDYHKLNEDVSIKLKDATLQINDNDGLFNTNGSYFWSVLDCECKDKNDTSDSSVSFNRHEIVQLIFKDKQTFRYDEKKQFSVDKNDLDLHPFGKIRVRKFSGDCEIEKQFKFSEISSFDAFINRENPFLMVNINQLVSILTQKPNIDEFLIESTLTTVGKGENMFHEVKIKNELLDKVLSLCPDDYDGAKEDKDLDFNKPVESSIKSILPQEPKTSEVKTKQKEDLETDD